MALIVAPDGWTYALTPTDKVWLAISAQYEGGDDPADIWWTYAQRLALPGFRSYSMRDLVANHSQPVNPKWRRDGEFCRPGGTYADTSRCAEARLATRDEAAAKIAIGWSAVAPQIARRFVDWENGRVPKRVGKAVDFADPAVSESFVERNPGSVVTLRAGNWFIATPASLARGSIDLRVGEAAAGVGVLVIGFAAAFAAWKLWSRKSAGFSALEGPRGKPPTEEEIRAWWAKQRLPASAPLPPPPKTKQPWQRRGAPPTQADIDAFWRSLRPAPALLPKEETTPSLDPEEVHYRKARHL